MLHAVLELVGPQGTVQERALEDACRKEKGLWWGILWRMSRMIFALPLSLTLN